MNIEQIFEKPLKRNINGVVKAEQTDDESAWVELDEYVITRELDGHLRQFFEVYAPATGPGRLQLADKMGVWVSGFFGSGKSHFIKILSYLLANREVSHNGVTRNALSFFEEKIDDALLLADIRKAVQHPTDVVLFNIDSRANVEDGVDAILKVFLKVFNELAGYCGDFPHIAHLERELDKRGQFDTFKAAFADITGSHWEDERDVYLMINDQMAKALSIATKQSEESSRQWIEQLDKNFPLDIKNFCTWVKEWLDIQGNRNILFMVDEVGQFIGKDAQMMLKLQTITENLGVICGGRAWVIVTSQADINAAIGGMSSRDGQDFSKIQGRFSTRLQLSSSNTSEVIQKRLLVKTDTAKPALEAVWQEKGDILRNQLAFDTTTTATLRAYSNSKEFVDNYPFVPWHYQILQKVFESIRTKGAAGKQLAMGERSLLDAFQSAAVQISADGLDSLVPFWRFYSAIESFLEPAVSRTIIQACQSSSLTEFDGKLLKTLFLIRYVDVLKSTLDNLVTLSIDRIDTDKVELRRQIEASLNRLQAEMLISRIDDKFVFLTNEEKEIENEIRNIDIEFTTINKQLSTIIFDEILKNKKYRYPANKQDFDISRFCNGHPLDGANLNDLVVKILTPLDSNYESYRSAHSNSLLMTDSKDCILIYLPDEARTWQDLTMYAQTKSFLSKQSGQRPEQATLLAEKGRENGMREKTLKTQIEALLAQSDVWALGERLDKKSSSPVAIVDAACGYVIENSFSKLKMLRLSTGDVNRETHALLTVENDTQLDLGEMEESNPEAMREVDNWISMSIDTHKPVYLRDILTTFGRRPFGWPEDEVKLLVARLARSGKYSFNLQGSEIALKQAWDAFNNSRRYSDLRLLKIRRHDEAQLTKAAQLMADIAGEPFNEREEQSLVSHIRELFGRWKSELTVFKTRSESGQNPGRKEIEEGLVLLNGILSEKEEYAVIEKVTAAADDLKDFAEDWDDLVSFYKNQYATWQRLSAALNGSFKANRNALEKDDTAQNTLRELEAIYGKPRPYGELHRIIPLIETVEAVNQRLVEEYRNHALMQIINHIEDLKQSMQEMHVPPDLQHTLLHPMQQSRKKVEQNGLIPQIMDEQSEVRALLLKANERLNAWVEEQRKKEIKPEPESGGVVPPTEPKPKLKKTIYVNTRKTMERAAGVTTLDNAEQVDKALEQLRKTLMDAINAGERVQLQ
ncbi:BREX system P-loop protein BrxC [Yersinia ruckeri]|nr:BREX system P-loop protein BrxC [Yersinia ruckeri]ELI6451254.1 BREX system P-loop protein BrxC [Yersinia ruckeri]